MKKYNASLLMVAAAVGCLVIHFVSGWSAFQSERGNRNESMADYAVEWTRDTFENIQSEAWQLAAQFFILAGGLSALKIKAYEEDLEEIKEMLRNRDKWADLEEFNRRLETVEYTIADHVNK